MTSILFVCLGNICRSPMAEFVFRDLVQKRGLGDRFHIASAATSAEELGNPVHPGTRRRLAREGIEPELWEQLKKAAYGSMVRQLNSMDGTCAELAQAHFDGEDYLSFPQCFQSIERSDAEALLRSWCVEDRAALSVIRPLE